MTSRHLRKKTPPPLCDLALSEAKLLAVGKKTARSAVLSSPERDVPAGSGIPKPVDPRSPRTISMRTALIVSWLTFLLMTTAVWQWSKVAANARPSTQGETHAVAPVVTIGPSDVHKPLRVIMDVRGVLSPRLVDVDTSRLPNDALVIGIVVNGRAVAFARDAMVDPARHIVNLTFEQTPISVTYCNMADCVRVLTTPHSTVPIDLHIGGLDFDNQMVLLLDGVRYAQTSADVPLRDYPFEVTTLGDWKSRHADTRVFSG